MCKFWFTCPGREFVLESWLTSLLPTYWTPSSYNISNKSSELIIRYKVASFWLKLGPIYPFSTRYVFWENWLLLLCTCCVLSCYSILKKFSETKSSKRLHNFVSNLAWVDLSIKKEFIGNVDQHFIGLLYPVMLHNFKKILCEQIIRLHNLCPNYCLPQKIIFLENWLMSNYCTPLC